MFRRCPMLPFASGCSDRWPAISGRLDVLVHKATKRHDLGQVTFHQAGKFPSRAEVCGARLDVAPALSLQEQRHWNSTGMGASIT